MSVTVISNTADYPEVVFETGDSWHIDPEQHLHVRDADKKHVAVFARGEWVYAKIAKAGITVHVEQAAPASAVAAATRRLLSEAERQGLR